MVLLLGIMILNISLAGQDSTWINLDLAMCASANAEEMELTAAEYLASRLGARRSSGPVTNQLIENYRKTALWYDTAGKYELAYRYIDTTIQLHALSTSLSLTSEAKAEHLYGQILYHLTVNGPSQYWYDRGLETLKKSIQKGDSIGTNRRRIQYFITWSAQLAAQNLDFARSDLVNAEFLEANRKGIDSVHEWNTLLYRLQHCMAKGLNLQKQERFPEARAVYRQCLSDEYTSIAWKPMQVNLLILRGNYANTYIEAGDYAEGKTLADEILSDFLPFAEQSPEYRDRIVVTYGYLLNALQGLERYEGITPALREAIKMQYRTDSTGKGRNLGLVYTFAAKAAAKQANFSRADSLFALARSAFVGDATPIGSAQLPRIAGNQIYGCEEFLYFLSEYRDAWLLKDAAGEENGLHNALATSRTIDSLVYRGASQLSLLSSVGRFLGLENRHFAKGIDIGLQLYRRTGDVRYLKEAFGFVSRQKSNLLRRYLNGQQLAESFDVPQEIIGEKIALETAVLITEQALYDADKSQKAALRNQLLSQQQQLQELRRSIESDYPAFSRALRGSAAIDPVTAASELESNRLVVEYFLSADSLYLFTLSAKDGVRYRILPRPGDLDALINGFFTDPDAPARLYDLLVAPALAGLNGITRVQFIPDGSLWKVPFAALRRDGEFLIRSVAVSYAYSSPLLFNPSSGPAPGTGYLGNGISYYDVIKSISAAGNRSATDNHLRDMGALPYARREVEEMAGLFGGISRLDTDATKERFLREAPEAGIIHLAMHGIIEKNPMESALVFRGEDAEKYDLLRMKDLLGQHISSYLTVLSACHSGNGPVETAEGMQTIGLAFTAAGSRATITSNWAARDASTSAIIEGTFTSLKDREYADVALQRATITYLDNGTAADRQPMNWAHLSLTGSTAPLFSRGLPWYFWLVLTSIGMGVGLLIGRIRTQPRY